MKHAISWKPFFFYRLELTQALPLLGRHSEELEAAGRARELFPDHPGAALLELIKPNG